MSLHSAPAYPTNPPAQQAHPGHGGPPQHHDPTHPRRRHRGGVPVGRYEREPELAVARLLRVARVGMLSPAGSSPPGPHRSIAPLIELGSRSCGRTCGAPRGPPGSGAAPLVCRVSRCAWRYAPHGGGRVPASRGRSAGSSSHGRSSASLLPALFRPDVAIVCQRCGIAVPARQAPSGAYCHGSELNSRSGQPARRPRGRHPARRAERLAAVTMPVRPGGSRLPRCRHGQVTHGGARWANSGRRRRRGLPPARVGRGFRGVRSG
jgi:hypothetical protein